MNNYLKHYGVKGMKWGIRRYQNEDGTLTNAGKKRQQREENRSNKKDRKEAYNNRRNLSDEELNARIKRLETERKLKQLTNDDIRAGRSEAKKILYESGSKIAKAAVAGGLAFGAAYATNKFGYKMMVRSRKFIDLPNPVPPPQPDWMNLAKWMVPNPNRKK